jgi:hypothetical protein
MSLELQNNNLTIYCGYFLLLISFLWHLSLAITNLKLYFFAYVYVLVGTYICFWMRKHFVEKGLS